MAERSDITTLGDAYHWAYTMLGCQADARCLCAEVFALEFGQLRIQSDRMVSGDELELLSSMIQKRLDGVPIAYILGYQDFYLDRFEVGECTLIPRQDTESLVDYCLQLPLPVNARVLELGTGTGVIALSLKRSRPSWRIMATDIRADAVALARRNAKALELAVSIVESDWFAEIPAQLFDLVVTNPPYVEPGSLYLQQGDLRFEPNSALVSQQNGLADIKHIVQSAPHFLAAGGDLVIEHGAEQGAAVRELFCSAKFSEIVTGRDLNDKERFTHGRAPRSEPGLSGVHPSHVC